jgi:hypothetical protein
MSSSSVRASILGPLPRVHALPGGRNAGFRGRRVAVYNGGRRLRSATELCTHTPTEGFVIDDVAMGTAAPLAPFQVGTGAGV